MKILKMSQKKIFKAVKLYQDFSGHKPEFIDTIQYPNHNVLMAIGHCNGIMYETVRDGKKERYIHKFKKGSRPVLAVSHDGKQLYLIAGSYRFTDAGIEDR